MTPIWYDVGDGLVDLAKMVAIERYCPAKYMDRWNDQGEHAFVVGTLPVPDRYGNTEVYLFSGNWLEANAELQRIKSMLVAA